MEEKVLHILRTVLENNTLDKTCSQENCEAWDSLHHLNICFELEGVFGVFFQPDEMARIKSYDDIIRLLNEKLG